MRHTPFFLTTAAACRAAIRALTVALALFFGISDATAANSQRVVVIDPGHGGADTGAVGQNGVTEKHLALDLANRIASHLRGRFRIELTRTSDVGMTIDERPGRANHENADAFVSLHAGASLNRTTEGITLIYYTGNFSLGQASSETAQAPLAIPAGKPWRQTQIPHRAASSALAHRIKTRLDAPPAPSPVTVVDAPVRVLMGADMPAVIIEVGYLTNPVEEKRLMDSSQLTALAMRISQGIDDFFNTMDTISASDLKN